MRVREQDTVLIPYQPEEIAWARQRPPEHRVACPAVGDALLYRHDSWGPPVAAVVESVEDLDDRTKPNLWQIIRDPVSGRILATPDHVPVAERLPDPWPVLHIRSRHGIAITQEARLRGSAGWLPLDWETRYRPTPDLLIVGG